MVVDVVEKGKVRAGKLGLRHPAQKVRIFRKCLTPTPMNDTTVSPFHVCAGIAQMSNYRRDYFGSCFSTLWMRGRSCLFWCLQLILFSFAPISGSFVALVLAASLQFSLFLVFVVIVDGFWFRFVCGQSSVYFWSSVTFVNGVHIYNHQNYYCAGAITSFQF